MPQSTKEAEVTAVMAKAAETINIKQDLSRVTDREFPEVVSIKIFVPCSMPKAKIHNADGASLIVAQGETKKRKAATRGADVGQAQAAGKDKMTAAAAIAARLEAATPQQAKKQRRRSVQDPSSSVKHLLS